MADDNKEEDTGVTVVEQQSELDDINTVPVNFSVPPNSVILVISPHESGLMFQRQSTITPESVNDNAVGASNLMDTIMWALAKKQNLFQQLFQEMVAQDWTLDIKGNA